MTYMERISAMYRLYDLALRLIPRFSNWYPMSLSASTGDYRYILGLLQLALPGLQT